MKKKLPECVPTHGLIVDSYRKVDNLKNMSMFSSVVNPEMIYSGSGYVFF